MIQPTIFFILIGCLAVVTANAQTQPDSLALTKQKATEEMMLRSAISRFSKKDSINQQPQLDTVASDSLRHPTFNSLWDRVVKREFIMDNSERLGIVVLEVCLDSLGSVISADCRTKGSTTSDEHLIQLSQENIRSWEFLPSSLEKQCGTISFHFRVK